MGAAGPEAGAALFGHRQASGPVGRGINLVNALRDDLQATLDGWGGSFAGSDRSERFTAAVESLEAAVESLEAVDVSW